MKTKIPPPNPEHLKFLGAYSKRVVDLALATRELVLEEAVGATELIYDAYSAVSAGYSFTGRPGDTCIYVAAYSKQVNIGFYRGKELKDPKGLLQGTGNVSRHLPIHELADLQKPYVRAFIKAAVKLAPRPDEPVPPTSVVRAVYKNKRRPL